MVTEVNANASAATLLLMAQQEPLLQRLEPLHWLRVVTGLILIVVLGLVLVLVVLTGGRMARAYIRRQAPPRQWDEDDWARPPVKPVQRRADDATDSNADP